MAVYSAILIPAMARRFRDIGISPNWSIVALIPLVSIIAILGLTSIRSKPEVAEEVSHEAA